jgi:hypothetical protein
MACSNCGGSLYSCHVTAGGGIAITGDGSVTNPYLITNTGDATGSVTCAQVAACLTSGNYVAADTTPTNGQILAYNTTTSSWHPTTNYLHATVGAGVTNIITSTDTATILAEYRAPTGQTADLVEWKNPTGGIASRITAAGYPRAASQAVADIPLRVQAAAGQTANLTEWTDPAGTTVLASIGAGGIVTAPNVGPNKITASATAPSSPNVGDVWVDTSGA